MTGRKMYYCSVLFAFLTIYGISADKEAVKCTPSLNSSIVSICTVTSNQDLLLNCSVPDSRWYRNESLDPICSQSQCELLSAAIGYSETAGLYYCTDSNDKYFVNIKVLGSPEFVSMSHSPIQCIHPTYCEYERIEDNIGTPVLNFSVKVIGSAPFTVAWLNGSETAVNACMPNTCQSNKINNDTYLFSYYFYNPKHSMDGYMYVNVSNDYGYNISRIYYKVHCKTTPNSLPISPSANTLLQPSKGHSVNINCSMKSSMVTRIGICYFTSDTNINQIIKNEQLFNTSCALCTPSSDDRFCEFSLINKQNWKVTTQLERDQNNCSDLHMINVLIPHYQYIDSQLRFQCFYQENDVNDRRPFQYWIGFHDRKWFLWLTTLTIVLPFIITITVIIHCARRRRNKFHKSSKIIENEYCNSSDDETSTINPSPSIYGSIIEPLDPVKNSNEIDV